MSGSSEQSPRLYRRGRDSTVTWLRYIHPIGPDGAGMKHPASDLHDLATQRPESLEAYWMPFTANRQYKAAPRAGTCRGHALRGCRRPPDPRRHRRPVVLQCRPCPPAHRRGHRRAGAHAGLLTRLPDGLAAGVRTGAAVGRAGAGAAQPCVLHQLRLRGGGYRDEDRAGLPPPAWRRPAHPFHQPREGLPRRRLRRHGAGRAAQQPQVVRPATGRCGLPAAHPGSAAQCLQQGPATPGRGAGRRPGTTDRTA